jgi:hypothetical protein
MRTSRDCLPFERERQTGLERNHSRPTDHVVGNFADEGLDADLGKLSHRQQ